METTPLELALADAAITWAGETRLLRDLKGSVPLVSMPWDKTERQPQVRVFQRDHNQPHLDQDVADADEAKRLSLCIADLIAGAEGTLAYVDCRECGEHERLRYQRSKTRWLVSESLCFFCGHWTEHLRSPHPLAARVNGRHYIPGSNTGGTAKHRGSYGDKFVIRYHDGRTVETVDLWHQGTIPDHFRDRMPDNAELERAS